MTKNLDAIRRHSLFAEMVASAAQLLMLENFSSRINCDYRL